MVLGWMPGLVRGEGEEAVLGHPSWSEWQHGGMAAAMLDLASQNLGLNSVCDLDSVTFQDYRLTITIDEPIETQRGKGLAHCHLHSK